MTPTSDSNLRTCNVCNTNKPLDEFYNTAAGKGTRKAKCKECCREYARQKRKDPAGREKEYAQYNKRKRERYAEDENYRAHVIEDSIERYRLRYSEDDEFRQQRLTYNAARKSMYPHIGWKALAVFRLKEFGFAPIVEDFTREDVTQEYGDACFYCDDGNFTELDHYQPVSAGGPHTLKNVRPSCRSCNRLKRAQDGDDFMKKRGRLKA